MQRERERGGEQFGTAQFVFGGNNSIFRFSYRFKESKNKSKDLRKKRFIQKHIKKLYCA